MNKKSTTTNKPITRASTKTPQPSTSTPPVLQPPSEPTPHPLSESSLSAFQNIDEDGEEASHDVGNNGEEDNRRIDSEKSPIPVLNPYQGSIHKDDLSQNVIETILSIPSTASPHEFKSNANLFVRRQEALKLAIEAFEKDDLTAANPFSRRLAKDVFPEVVTTLDDLFSRVRRCSIKSNPEDCAYALNTETHRQIMAVMFKCRGALSDLIIAGGEPVPELPTWGAKGDLSLFYDTNDFEILAVQFRAEVEEFFRVFDRHFNFLTNQPRSPDLIEYFSKDIDSASQNSDIRKKGDSDKPKPRRNTSERAPYPGRKGGRQRYSGAFLSAAPETNSVSRGSKGKPTGAASTPRLNAVLGNVGERHNQQRKRDNPPHLPQGSGPGDPSDDSDDSDDENRNRGSRNPLPKSPRKTDGETHHGAKELKLQEPHFDVKFKLENIPKWDGDTDTLVRWLTKVNNLARLSPAIFQQLGAIVPRRLEGAAEVWYWSQPESHRDAVEENWDTLKGCITSYLSIHVKHLVNITSGRASSSAQSSI